MGARSFRLSAIYDDQQSINAGFAVFNWRPNSFATGVDAFNNAPVGNIFTGVNVDVGVSDSDAEILSLGYNITLRGKIVFTKTPVTLFQSNFESTPVNQPPTAAQAVGTATSNGPIEVISPPFVLLVATGHDLARPWGIQRSIQRSVGAKYRKRPRGLRIHFPGDDVCELENNYADMGFDAGDGMEFLKLKSSRIG